MERLLLVNFEQDPDSIYMGFEPQVFEDDINGKGHIVIAWRKDKKVDVYHQKSLRLDAAKFNIAGDGLNKMIPSDMEAAFFEINQYGVQAHYKFKDADNRQIEIKIEEANKAKRKPFGILAPMGDATSHPQCMPLVLLHNFYFVRKKHTTIKVTINNTAHKVDMLTVPIDWQSMTFMRFSSQPLIARFNPAFDGCLKQLEVKQNQELLESKNISYQLKWIGEQPHIKSMKVENNVYPLTLHFEPALPSINFMAENSEFSGSFSIAGHPSVGIVAGVYSIGRAKNELSIKLIPSKGWQPKATKFSTWFLFSVAKIFKKWPTTYQWEAKIKLNNEGNWHMQSNWIRTGKIS